MRIWTKRSIIQYDVTLVVLVFQVFSCNIKLLKLTIMGWVGFIAVPKMFCRSGCYLVFIWACMVQVVECNFTIFCELIL